MLQIIKHLFYCGDALEVLKKLPDESVHCVVTSPPYWGLRNYGVEGQLGLEKVPDCLGWITGNPCGECYVCHMVQVFQEVRRVLRRDGTLWLNLGDSYAGSRKGMGADGTAYAGPKQTTNRGSVGVMLSDWSKIELKPKDLIGIPWRVALALQADGWWLRSDIIWAKPNSLPESVKDRPTKAHEYVFLLTKSKRYFYDAEAIKEPLAKDSDVVYRNKLRKSKQCNVKDLYKQNFSTNFDVTGKNRRSVWLIKTEPFPEAHFATFPTALVEPCIKAGTSEKGCCPKCGAPWERVIERKTEKYNKREGLAQRIRNAGVCSGGINKVTLGVTDSVFIKTVGWRPTCSCGGAEEPAPCVVLDPFGGAGTVSLVAKHLGRSSIYIDLNPEYLKMAVRRFGDELNLSEKHILEVR